MSALRLSVLLLAGAALSGCASGPLSHQPTRAETARTPIDLWAAEVRPQAEEIALAVHAQGLSPTQSDALAGFAGQWREGGRGAITLRAPVGGPDPAMVSRSTESARALLASYGADVQVQGYDAQGDRAAPLIVARERYTVSVPTCGQQWDNLSRSATNQVQSQFGCAVSANMAVQVANPADLLGPRAVDPADAQRRDVVLGKYRKGEITASARDEQAQGTVSQVIK